MKHPQNIFTPTMTSTVSYNQYKDIISNKKKKKLHFCDTNNKDYDINASLECLTLEIKHGQENML